MYTQKIPPENLYFFPVKIYFIKYILYSYNLNNNFLYCIMNYLLTYVTNPESSLIDKLK